MLEIVLCRPQNLLYMQRGYRPKVHSHKLKKSNGPRTDPWGTPQVTSNESDKIPLASILQCLFVKYDRIHSRTVDFIPYPSNVSRRMSKSTQSKAFVKSRKIAREYKPSSYANFIFIIRSVIGSSMDLFFQNPYCLSERILLASKYSL